MNKSKVRGLKWNLKKLRESVLHFIPLFKFANFEFGFPTLMFVNRDSLLCAHLFQLLEAKMHILKPKKYFVRLVRISKLLFVKSCVFIFEEKSQIGKAANSTIAQKRWSAFQVTIGDCTIFPNCPLVILKNPTLSLYL